MYVVKTDEKFYEQFEILETRVKELSCLFQNPYTEAEVKEWNTIASKLQKDLGKLIADANNRFITG